MHYFSILSTATYAMKDFRFQSLWISLWHIMKQRKRTKKVFQFSVEHIVLHKQKILQLKSLHYIKLFLNSPAVFPYIVFYAFEDFNLSKCATFCPLFVGHSPPTNVSGPLYDSFKIFENFLLTIFFFSNVLCWLGNDDKITM